jgi:uncharacterized membrane protein
MSNNQYNFVTVWKIEAPIKEVWDVICDTENLPSWWKAVEDIKVIDRGDESGANFLVEQTWKGLFRNDKCFKCCSVYRSIVDAKIIN